MTSILNPHNLDVLIYSVAHTGTRFTKAFLDYINVRYDQKHSDINPKGYDRIVVPYRDPAKQFVSLYKRHRDDASYKSPFEDILELSARQWQGLIDNLEGRSHVLIRIDNPDTSQLQVVSDYLGGGHKRVLEFGWPVMHPFCNGPSSIDELPEDQQLMALDRLDEYRARYGYT